MTNTIYSNIGESVYTEKLENGLTVMVTVKKGYVKTYAYFAADYGSVDTSFKLGGRLLRSPDGVAHFLEHKMFETEEGNALQMLASYGASPNAYTSFDLTAYHFECTENFEQSFKTLLSFVSKPYFTPESVEKEQGIIAQEIRMGEDNPNSQVLNKLLACLYKNHPIRVPIAGTVESIAEITSEVLYDCHRAFYCPSNMILCVVGDVDPLQVVEIAREMLPEEACEPIERVYGDEPELPAALSSEIKMEVSRPLFMIGFKTKIPAEGEAALRAEMLGEISAELLMGRSSPLYAGLYEQGLINSQFSAGFEALSTVSLVLAGGESQEPQRVFDAILEEAEVIRRRGLESELFKRLKKSYYGRRLRELNSFDTICYRQAGAFFRKANYMSFPEIFDSITEEACLDFIVTNLIPEKAAISKVIPG